MRILVNGVWRDIDATVLSAALEDLGYAEAVVSTAVNGEFVPATERSATPLAPGDRVEVLAPQQGG